jgi:hypothetical protein
MRHMINPHEEVEVNREHSHEKYFLQVRYSIAANIK